MKLYPYKVIFLFFIISVVLGTIFLSLPFMATKNIPLIDRVFTITSAICVTGLTTVDVSLSYTFWGQFIILFMIQCGGLGYMLLGTLMIILFGRINLLQKRVIGESLNVTEITNVTDVIPLMKSIIIFTFSFEIFGTVALFLKFCFGQSFPFLKSLWYAIFHSISAFCNAGFSLFSNNFENYHSDLVINIFIPLLIISGGLGFIVWMDIFQKLRGKKENFLLHTKIVFLMTSTLLLLGSLLIFLFNKFEILSLKSKILVSWFQSVTSRTAGFDTFPINQMSTLAVVVIICLMFIGASPGGTGGGIKTTTFFVILASVYNYISSGQRDVSIFKRKIDINTILKSFSIFFISLCWVIFISSVIHLSSGFSYKECLFETVSAFGTVGLSLGITPYLDNFSKILLIITMLLGRVGSLSLFSLLFIKEPKEIKYLEEPVAIG